MDRQNTISISVPPPMVNQVETSMLLTTSPRLIGFLEPSRGGVFGMFGIVAFVSHRVLLSAFVQACGASTESTPPA